MPVADPRLSRVHEQPRQSRVGARRSARGALLGSLLTGVSACADGVQALHRVDVVGSDYAFTLPDTLPPGPTRFAFTNQGYAHHELMLAALKPGVTLDAALAASAAGRDTREFLESGASVLYASPGQVSTAELLVDLKSGRSYVAVCLMRDAEGAPRHTELGMATSFVVR